MKREAFNHPKILLAARDLGIWPGYFRGLLLGLWHLAGTNFPRGDVGRLSNEELAVAMDCPPEIDPDQLVEVLVKRRLLDALPQSEGRLYVHDWHEHCDDYTRQKLRNRGQVFANGAQPYSTRLNARNGNHRQPQTTTDNHRQVQVWTENDSRAEPEPEPEPAPEPAPAPVPPLSPPEGGHARPSARESPLREREKEREGLQEYLGTYRSSKGRGKRREPEESREDRLLRACGLEPLPRSEWGLLR